MVILAHIRDQHHPSLQSYGRRPNNWRVTGTGPCDKLPACGSLDAKQQHKNFQNA
jgi:hypothetical protein